MMAQIRRRGLVFAALLAALASQVSAGEPIEERGVVVPLTDGTRLRATVLRPATPERVPVLVYRTPYGAENALREYTTFRHAVERGYAVVVQDVRGRYASEGVFEPYRHEGRDGFETIEWAARQPWSNGRIGSFGLSYPGAVQWLAALERPPHLIAMVPAMTFASPRRFFYANGAFDLSWIDWIWNDITPDARVHLNLEGPRTDAAAEAEWQARAPAWHATLPLARLDLLRDVAPYYYDWLRHPPEDPWWNWAEVEGRQGQVPAAVLNLSGWYDDYYGPDGATRNYAALVAARPPGEARTALLIGPWVHGVDSTQTAQAGERRFAAGARIDYDALVLDWMDHFLRGTDNGIERRPPVRYFVMGLNQWRESMVWPPPARATSWYLTRAAPGHPGGLTLTVPRAAGGKRAESRFISRPDDPVPDRYWQVAGAHDYRYLAERTDLLTFETAPLERDTEVTGPVVAEIHVACDCRDFDLWARLYDVDASGSAWNLMSAGNDVLRASYREPARGRQLLEPGRTYLLRIAGPVTSTVFGRGHRIRLQISGSFAPGYSRNLQTGERESESAATRAALLRVSHAPGAASRLILPIVR